MPLVGILSNMEFAVLLLLFVMNAFNMTTENPISHYRFDVNPVEICPKNATEFETAARTRNCSGNGRYLCAPDRNLSNLIEFCTDTKRSLFEKGNCVQLEGTGDLNHYRCVESFVSGCPTEPYTDDEIYKYPACLQLNLDFNCFVANKNCQKRNSEPETFDGSIKLQIVIFIVNGFLYVAVITGLVAIYLHKRETYKKAIMPPKKRARRDDVATGGVPPPTPPTEVHNGKKGQKRTRKQAETDTVNVLSNLDYELLAKEIVNQQKAASEKQNIGESVGQPPMVNSIVDTAPVVGEAIPAAATIPASAAATIPASALGTLLDNVFTGGRGNDSLPSENEKEEYQYFSNNESVFSLWYPCTFVIGDKRYNCAQQYMMYKKAEIMGDWKTADFIMTLTDPGFISLYGRRVENFKQDAWENCRETIVESGNTAKFSQNEELKKILLSTYPKTLVEARKDSVIWGIGLDKEDPRRLNKQTWQGKNLLGKILTEVRERLRNDIENVSPNGNQSDF